MAATAKIPAAAMAAGPPMPLSAQGTVNRVATVATIRLAPRAPR